MKTLALLAALGCHTLAALAAEAPAAHDDHKRLQGVWVIESATQNGNPVKDLGEELVFAGDQMTMRGANGREQKGAFKIDPAQSPKSLAFTPERLPANASPGQLAYEVSGDALKLVMASPDKKPVEISDKGQILITLKRKKP